MQRTLPLLLLSITCAAVAGCQNEAAEMGAPQAQLPKYDGVVDVKAVGLKFEAPDSIPSGWTTFRFENTADVPHFAVIERLPEGFGIADHQEQVAPVFQIGMDYLSAGKPDSAFAAFGNIPEWFGEIVFTGGPGLTAPGRTSQSTVYLEPGTYLLECYVKTDGNFHSYNANPGNYGMVHQFTVTEDVSEAPVPTADLNITLSNERGIEVDSLIAPGEHTIAVHFESQQQHENFVQNDIHLARLGADADLPELASWVDWTQPTGLQDPSSVEFLGGLEEMPAGSTGYFTVTLEPGRYAWVSEVTNPADKGMLKVFTVAGESQ